MTFPIEGQGSEAVSSSQYLGISHVEYSKGLNIGYRWYDTRQQRPAFAFVHGLSYTTFAIEARRLRLPVNEQGSDR